MNPHSPPPHDHRTDAGTGAPGTAGARRRRSSAFGSPRRDLFESDPVAAADVEGDGRQSAQPRDPLVVVTGGGGLLGAAIAGAFAARGARVCLLGRDVHELRDTISTLPPGSLALSLRCDLGVQDEVTTAADFLERIDGRVDVLVHAAGLREPATIAGGDPDALDEHYLINVRGPYLLTQRLLGALRAGLGHVVFFGQTSDSAMPHDATGSERRDDVHHTISDAASQALVTALRSEVAEYGVRVLQVGMAVDDTDGFAATAMTRSVSYIAGAIADVVEMGGVDVTELQLRPDSRRIGSGDE